MLTPALKPLLLAGASCSACSAIAAGSELMDPFNRASLGRCTVVAILRGSRPGGGAAPAAAAAATANGLQV